MANDLKRTVRVWLAEQDKTQNWLAHKLGISSALLSLILDGYREPTDKVVARIHKLTGIDIRSFAQVA